MFYEKVNRFRGVVCDGKKISNDVDMSLVEKESYEYYKSALETGEHIAYLVYDVLCQDLVQVKMRNFSPF